MSTATVPTHIRTTDGVVKVDAGQRIPEGALPSEVVRLAAAGIIQPDAVNFKAMNLADLKAWAADHGVDLGEATKKADIIAALEAAGV
ncbi:hypothetical protein Back2_17840 [Nocardioides baekrokdamisoli]|uniref:Rho termination factor N-terminal domain-containing protein n=1 Tax=Nocardioides baekrokdamisoli TaxID=1804624 RepID=A0A3G9IEZ0_9ACTN|nr:hypothetical protein [Nocardioides baekrokdamisoli]BBH17497.1 hypothetical protein Back2_17840 [Nocardioides baekrokdamisoli]